MVRDPRPKRVRQFDARMANRIDRSRPGHAQRAAKRTAKAQAGTCLMMSLMSVTLQATFHLVRTGEAVGKPQTVLLRAIRWYRTNVSAGKNICPRGFEHCCSKQCYEYAQHHKVRDSIRFIFRTVRECKREQRAALARAA